MSLPIFIYDNCQQQLARNQTAISPPFAGNQNNPVIEFTDIPVYESFENLRGHVSPASYVKYKILVVIKVDNLWRIKPDIENMLTDIHSDGTWMCDITTAPGDHRATRINAFLVPDSFSLPPFAVADALPPDIFARSLASMEVVREDSSICRIVSFSGYQWSLRNCDTLCGAGPNYYSSSPENVWRDPQGYLHLKITRADTIWNCAEAILPQHLGYGTYKFELGKISSLDESSVLSFFTWDEATEQNHRQIDIKISSCAQYDIGNIQYDIQPDDENGNRHRFNLNFNRTTAHSFTWSPKGIYFESTDPDNMIEESWTYQGFDLPASANESPRINLWLCNPDSAREEFEIVIQKFKFTPFE